ncbi:unnamed protein product [Gongylonema pulchrum]|uniref:GPI ethanolamine phosphate transferase 1 n=1 Tax=Gongylonema pulchrum TaxID=637853 RepID=A0A183DJ05_9BILA|nr:unnamed protein product [Gongylonema pulchrum]
MAALLGCALPMNSFGTVHLNVLDATARYKFQAAYANLLQMLEQFMAKKNEKKARSLPFMFNDFEKLQPAALSTIESEMERLITQRRLQI